MLDQLTNYVFGGGPLDDLSAYSLEDGLCAGQWADQGIDFLLIDNQMSNHGVAVHLVSSHKLSNNDEIVSCSCLLDNNMTIAEEYASIEAERAALLQLLSSSDQSHPCWRLLARCDSRIAELENRLADPLGDDNSVRSNNSITSYTRRATRNRDQQCLCACGTDKDTLQVAHVIDKGRNVITRQLHTLNLIRGENTSQNANLITVCPTFHVLFDLRRSAFIIPNNMATLQLEEEGKQRDALTSGDASKLTPVIELEGSHWYTIITFKEDHTQIGRIFSRQLPLTPPSVLWKLISQAAYLIGGNLGVYNQNMKMLLQLPAAFALMETYLRRKEVLKAIEMHLTSLPAPQVPNIDVVFTVTATNEVPAQQLRSISTGVTPTFISNEEPSRGIVDHVRLMNEALLASLAPVRAAMELEEEIREAAEEEAAEEEAAEEEVPVRWGPDYNAGLPLNQKASINIDPATLDCETHEQILPGIPVQ